MEKAYINLKFIEENLDPKAITELLNIVPTKSGKKGDCIPGRKLPIKEGLWSYQYIIDEIPWNVGMAISTFLPLLESNAKLLRFCKDNNVYPEFSVILYLSKNTPIMTLDASLMRRLAAVNADIDVDIYLI